MKIISIIFVMSLAIYSETMVKVDRVTEKFKENYIQADPDWNPLWVGNLWQYSLNGNNDEVDVRYVEKDTVVNGITYYKKVDYVGFENEKFFLWERIDWGSYTSYMLDLDDINENSIVQEELLLDSLEVPNDFYEYTSYRFAYKGWKDVVWFGPTTVRVRKPEWYSVFGDTVLVREVEYLDLSITEYVADKYGVVKITGDFYVQTLTGARIYGEEYGVVTSINDEGELLNEFVLFQNYPNPFNPTTTISFSIDEGTHINLKVYNFLGEYVTTLVEQYQNPGIYKVKFNAENIASGVYFYVLESAKHRDIKKMILLK